MRRFRFLRRPQWLVTLIVAIALALQILVSAQAAPPADDASHRFSPFRLADSDSATTLLWRVGAHRRRLV